MCGIVGYIGDKNAIKIALEGIKRLEYRGYDSAGVVGLAKAGGKPFFKKSAGRISVLEAKIKKIPQASCAIAHTRWATHGEPTVANAHPHSCCREEIFVVHNGIIENHNFLRGALEREGHIFKSETDTEVLAHLIERSSDANGLESAVREALRHVKGTFGLAAVSRRYPDRLVAARRGSPLLVGVGEGEYFLASDAAALVNYTKRVIYLNDNEMAVLTSKGCDIFDFSKKKISKTIDTIDWDLEESQKGGYAHFMEKEIFEAPQVIKNTIGGRIIAKEGEVKLGGLEPIEDQLYDINRLVVVACGTSYYSALIGKYLFEEFAGLPVEVEYASEFRYHSLPLGKRTAVLAISQSGETADTLEAIREANRKGALTLGIVNIVGSSIAREVRAGVYNHAGPEIAVASTKAFLSQLTVLTLMAVYFGRLRYLEKEEAKKILADLLSLSGKIEYLFRQAGAIKKIAAKFKDSLNFLYLGRKYNWPVALEGALKLKEISYIHAEGYPAGEMKHGPIAVIEPSFPTIAIALKDSVYEKVLSNVEEIKARKGKVILICEEKDRRAAAIADEAIFIPKVSEPLSPILSVIPLQLFAYYLAVLKGYDVDKPRNLAKSVTVE
ncbi:MAG: glutamine--fructose-6-phosphate transaminase (isomerizing) [Candidatus Niyogibacteria bacterium]|nr:glutamine--fructose-6-phosphate transaminase (isomerizing) [Candidatus Niyogibacteria bacterium]